MRPKFLDANIILRYLTNDLPDESLRCERLFKNTANSKEALFTNILVIAEVIWVLFSGYHFPKDKVIEGIRKILNTPNIHLDEEEIILSALYLFEKSNMDFIDAYNAAMMEHKGISAIYSYDRHYDQVSEVKRLKP